MRRRRREHEAAQRRLTRQEMNAAIEYAILRTQIMTGRPVALGNERRTLLAKQILQQHKDGTPPDRETLSRMERGPAQ